LGKKNVYLLNHWLISADENISSPGMNISTPMAWMAAIAYSLQSILNFLWLFSILAIGLGKCLIFDMQKNFITITFPSPFENSGTRWHISFIYLV